MIPEYLSAIGSEIGPTIADHLWQSTLFAIAAGLLTLALRRNQARVRYGLWLAASLKFLIPFSLLIRLGGYLASPHALVNTQSGLYSAVEEAGQPFTQAAAPAVAPVAHAANAAHLLSILPGALAAVWLCGFVAILGLWWLRWQRLASTIRRAVPVSQGREVDALRRLERIGGVRKPIAFLLSRDSLEPGIFGIVHPVLVWPVGISEHLNDAHLEAILAHEIWHVRRRDNLAAAIHMLVEAIFWFHPLVWWLGARLVEERERACDEAVLQLGNAAEVYAESILKTCEFCVELPLACVSGITGAELKKRIVHIMTHRVAIKLDSRKKLLLSGAGLITVAVPLVFGLVTATQSGHGPQAQQVGTKMPEFEVTSIKLANSGIPMIRVRFKPDGFSAENVPLKMLLSMAYGIRQDLISGGPSWVNSARYDIEAKVAGPDVAELQKLSYPQRGPMLQPLLADRFKLEVHPETKSLAVYDLTIAKGGSKLHEAKPGDTYPNAVKDPAGVHADLMSWGPGQITDQVVPIASFATVLSQLLHRNIVDKTGLTGRYEIKLRWAREEGPTPPAPGPAGGPQGPESSSPPDSSGPSIFTAIQEQLGLRLVPAKGPVETLVIDHIEPPSTN